MFFLNGYGQKKETEPDSLLLNKKDDNKGYFRIMFYNVENLFDTENDPIKNDDEFLPEGARHWTPDKYKEKLKNIAKVIVAVGGWNPPAVVGLCEIENRKVLEDLTKKTPLSELKYSIIHYESPDFRGIDVAMLYRKEEFKPVYSRPIPLNFEDGRKSRDILYVKGITSKNDTLHIFVNHWPSKYGGAMETEPKRYFTAEVIKKTCDSIFNSNLYANIIIMGDLNDTPEDVSVREKLKAHTSYHYFASTELYNLTYNTHYKYGLGSHKYQGEWSLIDNIIVSGALLNKKNKIYTTVEDAKVFNAPFLLKKDERNVGFQPFRTYMGFTYQGGFADHLPVFLDLRTTGAEN
ncbi:MAG: hypothetical protein A2275_09355 [Bacteroidetes bacterium RIFOXYA12_FULL_35_11]|nr:MAG: hypothetical protein A2X01_13045 [Bacteroidetes bacterium GWF2_35_48]OFY78103.1 MAG: hypothetical protein A2275_09355 [Bacteroidetes bacterium RIFOXYA12_FULL_35_11]OFY95606.1 MAG: hypothetical protein A2491_16035 [Bacteroidetes bacterium RIFOXYC12_FULL_35_7]HBX53715.1 endonuclease [Bacteroidales bacterium]